MIGRWHGENHRVGTPSLPSPFAPSVIKSAAALPRFSAPVDRCSTSRGGSDDVRGMAPGRGHQGARQSETQRNRQRAARPSSEARKHRHQGRTTVRSPSRACRNAEGTAAALRSTTHNAKNRKSSFSSRCTGRWLARSFCWHRCILRILRTVMDARMDEEPVRRFIIARFDRLHVHHDPP